MVTVKIYSTPTCPWCLKAKQFFKEKKVKFTNLNVADNEKARNEMIEKSGQMGVPVIDIGGKIIVGFNEAEIKKALKQK
ncbi:MAG: glutathione S-transferase N-terminal domain-containing protein [Candidatus Margulisbacteria bacterium]|nr:glutathione S-transferase N-terminal domain-containing protein [Candidatus Margulisiibacteriota bacterium]MBU1622068.1 glutathione S-transferase N-terminal domain-containing protein [Nanoarchaeota archaeon]